MTGPESALDSEPVSVRTANGRASYLPLSPAGAVLEVQYHVPDLEAEVGDESLEAVVAELCEREVNLMRITLRSLGDELASLLHPEGIDVVLSRKWRNQEEREWTKQADKFKVAGSGTTMRDLVQHPEGTSEASLVRESVRQMIAQREQNIRGIYLQVLEDAGQAREAE